MENCDWDMPVDVWYTNGPEATVWWINRASHPMVEPFFCETVTALRKQSQVEEYSTGWSALLSRASALPDVRPAGLIFHIGRCGSTLLANALRTAAGVVILSEPQIVDGILLPPDSWHRPADWQDVQLQLLDSTIRLLGRTEDINPKVVIKTTPISILSIPLFRALWPGIPGVIIIRNPIEVVVSCLRSPTGDVSMRWSPMKRKYLGLENTDASMTVVEFCARYLGRLCDVAADSAAPHWQVIDYQDLTPSRIRDIGEQFDLIMPPADSVQFTTALSTYSKDARRGVAFHSDTSDKQKAATDLVRYAVRTWAEGPYLRLRRIGEKWNSH